MGEIEVSCSRFIAHYLLKEKCFLDFELCFLASALTLLESVRFISALICSIKVLQRFQLQLAPVVVLPKRGRLHCCCHLSSLWYVCMHSFLLANAQI